MIEVLTMKKEIYILNDYGTIYVDIKQMMSEKGLTRNSLARAINARFEVVNKWYNGNVEKIDADILARICYVLECEPNDIIKYDSPN